MAKTIRMFLAFLVVLFLFSPAGADQNATTDDGRRVILHSDWTWAYLAGPDSCPGAPQGVPTFSAFTSFVPDSGSASFAAQPGGLMPLVVVGGQSLISGNQFVPGAYMVAAAVSNPDGRAISSWQENGPIQFDAGHNYRAELSLDTDVPRVMWKRDTADMLLYSQPAQQRFKVYARNDDSMNWLSICIFPQGGSVQDCCFFEGGNVSYEPAQDAFSGSYVGEYHNSLMAANEWRRGSFVVGRNDDGSYYSSDTRGGTRPYNGQRAGDTITLYGTFSGTYYVIRMSTDGAQIHTRTYDAFESQGGALLYSGEWRAIERR